ncbi:MAG TPA: IPT/TIG domain-containing protein, partial [Ilumatobacteraceae bacterium]
MTSAFARPDGRARWLTYGWRNRWGRLGLALALLIGFATYAAGAPVIAANPVPGTLIAGAIDTTAATAGISPTLPRGIVWLPDASAAGGHWWVGDQLNGLCRLDPTANTANNGGFVLGVCNATAKSGGQVVAGAVPGDARSMYLYVADASSKSIKVVRYKITGVDTAAPAIGSSLTMNVQNISQKGGGTAGGRPTALALFNSPVAGQQDLLVGYIKSGDVMRVANVNNTTSGSPAVTLIGSTSDGVGVNSFAKVGNDVYIAEVGGLGGVSKIADPLGLGGRPPCSASSVCTAVGTGTGIGFPGGLAYDGSRFLYVSDTAKGGATNYVYRVDLTTSSPTADLVSSAVPPYSAKDSNQVQTTFNSYAFPLALGYRPNGDLYIGDDPQFLAAVVTNQQGHLWKVAIPPPAPTVTSIAPNTGLATGGTSVTITGTSFGVAPGATTVTFGAAAPVAATCASATSCTAVSPTGSGTVDVVVNVGGQRSAVNAADRFTYTAPAGPAITSINPSFGPAAGGTTMTITGTNLTSGGPSSIAFSPVGGGAAVPASNVTCNSTTCTATSPAGVGSADIVVTSGPSSSPVVPADVFSYTPSIATITPSSGASAGGDVVTISGTGFTATTAFSFDHNAGTSVSCASSTSCTVTTPGGAGTVDVTATVGSQSATAVGGFSYVAAAVGPQITGISPSSGSTAGGTVVTVTGTNFPTDGSANINFGSTAGTFVKCSSATTCTVDSPATANSGDVNVQLTSGASSTNVARFSYVQASASLYAWGITAPKGGAVWLPGALGGHWWSSDHAQGFCRQDPITGGRFALNFAVCGDDAVGSAGQGVYDPRPAMGNPNLHYVYVPDNAVKSVAVWRLTFDSTTETMVPDPIDGVTMATGMAPLADVRTLKPNGMALGPLDGSGVFCGLPTATCTTAAKNAIGLYVTDLTEKYVRVITKPDGDPRNQTVGLVAATGDGRGANGTAGFIGNNLYVSGNRATQFFDVTLCPSVGASAPPATPACGMASVPSPAGVFV